MKKRILSLAAVLCLLMTFLPVTALAGGEYTKNESDYNKMVQYVQENNLNISLTKEYFSIAPYTYEKGNYTKLEFESDGAEVQAVVFRIPYSGFESLTPTLLLTNLPISFSQSSSYELDCYRQSGAVGYGSSFGINLLTTNVTQDTKITVSLYIANSAGKAAELADTFEYTLKAVESSGGNTDNAPLEMNVSCEDRSGAEAGDQVYVGDPVTVSFTGTDEFTGTSATFSFDTMFELSGDIPDGWSETEDGSYTYTVSTPSSASPGTFTLTVKTPSTGSKTGTLTLTSTFKDGEPIMRTATLDVIDKPIQYEIKDVTATTIGTVNKTYNGQPQSIEVSVTDPVDATIQYSTTSAEDQLDDEEVVWQSEAPEYTDISFETLGYPICIQISAEGYVTVEKWVYLYIAPAQLTITPKDVTIYVGDSVPTAFEYDTEGLIGTDTLSVNPAFKIKEGTVNTSQPGTYTIVVDGYNSTEGNYRITYGTGTLTVKEAQSETPDTPETPETPSTPSTPSASDKDDDDDGYSVSVPASSSIRGGSIAVSPRRADRDDTVTITVTPDDGYVLDELSVTDGSGDGLKLTWAGENRCTFTMPASRVDIQVSFKPIETAPVNPFADVSSSAYYYDAVLWAVENGVTNGTTATAFSPDVTVTRAQMVTFLWRAHGAPRASGTNRFTDVSADAYYYDAVLWAVESGITNGTSADTFSPNAPVTRAQAVTFQWRAAGAPAMSGGSFGDVAADAYYVNAVTWAVANGITNGTGADSFSPDTAVSRAQAVTFLYRELAE